MVKIEVTDISAVGDQFSNLIKGSIHKVVKRPKGWYFEDGDVCVLGSDGKPIRLLCGEFTIVKD